MTSDIKGPLSKLPEITLGFWVIKILATTLGETAGDAVSMSMNLGYLVSTAIFLSIFEVAVLLQINTAKFQPFLYWLAIIASTTIGTTLADFSTRSLGLGYPGGTTILFIFLLISLFSWKLLLGSVDIATVTSPKSEFLYWLTIMFSQTLGTALGDWTADSAGLGYLGAAGIFAALLAIVVLAHFYTKISKILLFWTAFVLTRPLGAVIGDLLDKPAIQGGLELSRYHATAFLFLLIIACIYAFPQHPAQASH